MFKAGDVVLAFVPFVDSLQIKRRPAVVLFEEMGNVVVAGITSNAAMKGIPFLKSDGAAVDSIIKPNYLFTIPESQIQKRLMGLSPEKRKQVFDALSKRLSALLN
jgi:mRNA interferase MazF